ncbi:MAG: hypothetical protein NC418_04415 [Muribaculaceae bacterium]|nr:hypothetical protein [Muribaculaceae bacterium]
MSEIDEYIAQQVGRITNALIYNLQYVGERCLNAARETNSYKDQTGNLRSSLGYVIASDGKIIKQSNFEVVKKGGRGAKSGIQFAKEVVRQFPEGVVLVMVAGMNYASYVAAKGYNVLDSAELLADKLVPKILKQLGLS